MSNINGIVVNTGSGNVTTGNITTGDIHQSITDNTEIINDFLETIKQIKEEARKVNNNQIDEAVSIIEEETKQQSWNKKFMKFCLGVIEKTGVALAANGLTTLAAKGLSLLSLL